MTFDGVSYIYSALGDYYLLLSEIHSVQIQVRLMRCYMNSFCIKAVGVKAHTGTVVLYPPEGGSYEPVVIVNNTRVREVSSTVANLEGHDAKLVWASRLKLRFSISSSFYVDVSIYGSYFLVSCVINEPKYCYNSSGLFGSCNNYTVDDLQTKPSRSLNSSWNIHTISQDYISRTFGQSCKVKSKDNLFGAAGLTANESSKVYAVRLENGALISDEIYSFSSFDVTFEMFLKVIRPGVLWTYTTQKTFGVIIRSTLHVVYDSNTVDTGLLLAMQKWYKVCVVHKKQTNVIQIHLVEMDGFSSTRTFVAITDKTVFEPGGILTIGKWYPSAADKVLSEGYTGDILEFRIWNKSLSISEVRKDVISFLPCNTPDLSSAWKFQQPQKNIIKDCVAGVNVKINQSPLASKVSWFFASLQIQIPSVTLPLMHQHISKLLYVERQCKSLLMNNPVFTSCVTSDVMSGAFFNYACMRELYNQDNNRSNSITALALSNYCVYTLNVFESSPKKLCDSYNSDYTEWYGTSCNKHCMFGIPSVSPGCACLKGFYGDSCQHQCSPSYANPCHGQAICDKSNNGTCSCPVNFDAVVDPSCGRCAVNWTLSDCGMISRTKSITYIHVCQSFSSNFVAFSGTAFNIRQFGEFYLYKTSHFNVQGRYLPCYNSTVCLHAIGIKFSATTLTVYNPKVTGSNRYVWYNGHVISVKKQLSFGGMLTIRPISTAKLEIRSLYNPGVNITLTFRDKDITVTLYSKPSTGCAGISGLCGSCDSYLDWKTSANNSQSLINLLLFQNKIGAGESAFIYEHPPLYETRNISSFDHVVYLNGTGAVTTEARNVFGVRTDFTIEIFVKSINSRGTLFSYANENTAGVVLSGTIRVYLLTRVIDTGIVINSSNWVRVVLTYETKISLLTVYHFLSSDVYDVRKFFIKERIFGPTGTFSLGYWQATSSTPDLFQLASFEGEIDEFRIWRKCLSSLELTYLHRAQLPYLDGLAAYWTFNEGIGNLIQNQISDLHFSMPSTLNSIQSWRFSSILYSLSRPIAAYVLPVNSTFKIHVEQKCKELIFHHELQSICGRFITQAFVDFYYIGCVQFASATNSFRSIYMSLLAYTEYCQKTLNIKTWIKPDLCDLIPESFYPALSGPTCRIPCVFGSVNNELKKCVCQLGHWGTDCSRTCPGGSDNPCTGHGTCNVTSGICDCLENWKGNANCSTCGPGWSGSDCETIVTPKPPSSTCTLMPGGHLVTLNSIHTTFFGYGEFYLLNSVLQNVSIHIHQTPCMNDRSRCLIGIAIRTKDYTVILKAPDSSTKDENIVVNGENITIPYKEVQYGNIVIRKNESNVIEVIQGSTLDILIRKLDREFSLAMKVTGLCNSTASLCSTCFESGRNIFESSRSHLESLVRVPTDRLLLNNGSFEISTYRLKLQGIGVSTNVLPSIYANKDLTIDIQFSIGPVHSESQSLLLYNKETTFGIVIQRTIKVYLSTAVTDTGLEVEKNKNNQITLVYTHESKQIKLYYINSNAVIRSNTIQLPSDVLIFQTYGTFILGQWVPGWHIPYFYPASGFFGFISGCRIWKQAYSVIDVKRIYSSRVSETDVSLLSYWKFNEGTGNLIYDVVSSVHFYIPITFNAPSWIRVTSYGEVVKLGNDVDFADNVKKQQAINWCYVKFYSSPLYLSCQNLGRQSIR